MVGEAGIEAPRIWEGILRIAGAARPGAWRGFPSREGTLYIGGLVAVTRYARGAGAIGTFLDPGLRQGWAGIAYIVFLKKCAILWPASSV